MLATFQTAGELTLWIGTLANVAIPLAQIMPLLNGLWVGIKNIIHLNWAGMWSGIVGWVRSAVVSITQMNGTLTTSNMISLGFIGNMSRATIGLVRFATVGIFNALKGLGALVLSFVTGGTASAAFSATASTSFGVFATTATTACRAVGVAIMNIPIIGWVAAAIAALIAIGAYFWNTSAKFRAVLKGTWAAFKACFTGIGELAKNTFGAIGDLIKAAFNLDADGISTALAKLKGGFSDYGKQIGQAFRQEYDAEIAASEKSPKKPKNSPKGAGNGSGVPVPAVAMPDPTGGSLAGVSGTSGDGGSDSGGKIKNITINIEKLVERFEIHSATVGESAEKVKAMMLEALAGALNDTQLATL